VQSKQRQAENDEDYAHWTPAALVAPELVDDVAV